MFIAAHHTIYDATRFWREVQNNPKPTDIKVHKIMRNQAGDRAAILWEAESVEALEQWFRVEFGDSSEEECSAVDSSREWGL